MAGEARFQIWKSPRFWLIVVVIFAIPLLADFNARLGYIRQMGAEAAELSKQIEMEEARRQALIALQDYVRSDEYVEHWARLARLAKPGETAVVPSVVGSTPSPIGTTPASAPAPNDPRNEWSALFLSPR